MNLSNLLYWLSLRWKVLFTRLSHIWREYSMSINEILSAYWWIEYWSLCGWFRLSFRNIMRLHHIIIDGLIIDKIKENFLVLVMLVMMRIHHKILLIFHDHISYFLSTGNKIWFVYSLLNLHLYHIIRVLNFRWCLLLYRRSDIRILWLSHAKLLFVDYLPHGLVEMDIF